MSHCKVKNTNFDDYEINEKLGYGRFSTVWSASKNGSPFAIKIYRSGVSFEKYFENEMKVLNKIKDAARESNARGHSIILHHEDKKYPSDFGIHNCIVFPRFHCSLSKLLRSDGNLKIPVAEKIMKDIFAGLEYLHSIDIIHTDIKPENILTDIVPCDTGPPTIKITIADLGSSAIKGEKRVSSAVGTVIYSAPEIIKKNEFDEKIDIWSAFVTFFKMITGTYLFDVDSDCNLDYGFAKVRDMRKEESESEEDESGGEMCSKSDCDCTESNTDCESNASDGSDGSDASDGSNDTSNDTSNSASDSASNLSTESERRSVAYHFALIVNLLGAPSKEFVRDNATEFFDNNATVIGYENLKPMTLGIFLKKNFHFENPSAIEKYLLAGLRFNPHERISAKDARTLTIQ